TLGTGRRPFLRRVRCAVAMSWTRKAPIKSAADIAAVRSGSSHVSSAVPAKCSNGSMKIAARTNRARVASVRSLGETREIASAILFLFQLGSGVFHGTRGVPDGPGGMEGRMAERAAAGSGARNDL